MRAAILLANILGWPVIQLSIAAIAMHMSPKPFENGGRVFRVWSWEPLFYRRVLQIKCWKQTCPDGARWVGSSFRKSHLEGRDASTLRRFILETQRGEAAHWAMLLCTPVFWIWNPLWAFAVMVIYGIGANLPCILVQRFNRANLLRVLAQQSLRNSEGTERQPCGLPPEDPASKVAE